VEEKLSDAPEVAAALQRFRNPRGRVSPAFGLDHIQRALQILGDPQDAIPAAIHITGTNGKGSTGAFIRAMAEAAGLKVHIFTSPHLMAVNERIRVASELVGDARLAATLNDIAAHTKGLTYFEALTAAAFVMFAETRADLSIIEVGAGGATDSTNVMARPAMTVVTPISRDHEAMFGVSGVAAIARLKAGIFREGVPAVLAEQPAAALVVLREEARLAGARIYSGQQHWKADWRDAAFFFGGARLHVRAPWLGLMGRHQLQNAGAACAAVELLNDPLFTPDTMAAGLREAAWPARLQKLGDGALTRDYGGAIIVDAAHNPGGAAALAEAIRAEREHANEPASEPANRRVALIVALQGAKDVEGVLAELAPVADDLIACELPDSGGQEGGPGAPPQHIAQIACTLGAHALEAGDFRDAIALAKASGAARIYICGSIYLCGAVLAANGERIT
jgi:dihydrofolate synthase/folylpolyglutamate synthase